MSASGPSGPLVFEFGRADIWPQIWPRIIPEIMDVQIHTAWVEVFRIIPELRTLTLTFHRKSTSKS